MKYFLLTMFACVFATNAFAQEGQQRIRDMSMSPTESLQQPSSSNNPPSIGGVGNPYQTNTPQQGYGNDPVQQRINQMQNNTDSTSSFMAGYCDPHATIGVGNPAMQSCLANTKQQTCTTFNRLPADVQQILDQSISCIAAISETDGTTVAVASVDSACSANDHRRLTLLKKYWNDQSTSYALVFLPDAVLNDSANCAHGGQ